MKNTSQRLLAALDKQLYDIALRNDTPAAQYKSSVLACKKALHMLKSCLPPGGFSHTAEEIGFFKNIKPQFYSRYIYYISLYNFTVQRPVGGSEIQEAYIRRHLAGIQDFFDHNRAFYLYYRAGMEQLDAVYFSRGSFGVHAELEDFQADERFSTTHDYKLSKLLANEKYQAFLQQELARNASEDLSALGKVFPFRHPQWTAGQTDAVELLYALKTGCAVNNGNIDIAELVAIWEFVFQMEINESYHKLLDITRRKKEMFVFLKRITDSFWNFIRDKFS